MANTTYPITGSGEGSGIGIDGPEGYNTLHYVELDSVWDDPKLAIQLPGLVGDKAVPMGTPHFQNLSVVASKFFVDKYIQQTTTPLKAIVRILYLAPKVLDDGVIKTGWSIKIDYATSKELRFYDLDGKPIGRTGFQFIPPEVVAPPQFSSTTRDGAISLASTGVTMRDGYELDVPEVSFTLSREFRRLTEGSARILADLVGVVNSNQFLGPPGTVKFSGANVSSRYDQGDAPPDGGQSTNQDSAVLWTAQVGFQFRKRGWEKVTFRETFEQDDGFVADVLDAQSKVLEKTYRIADQFNFDSILAIFET